MRVGKEEKGNSGAALLLHLGAWIREMYVHQIETPCGSSKTTSDKGGKPSRRDAASVMRGYPREITEHDETGWVTNTCRLPVHTCTGVHFAFLDVAVNIYTYTYVHIHENFILIRTYDAGKCIYVICISTCINVDR